MCKIDQNLKLEKKIWNSCRVFVLQNQECNSFKLVLYSSKKENDILILIVNENFYVITDNVLTITKQEDFKKIKIALNLALPSKDETKNKEIVFSRINDVPYNNSLAQEIIDIIKKIES